MAWSFWRGSCQVSSMQQRRCKHYESGSAVFRHIAQGRSAEDGRQEEVLGTLKVGYRSEEIQGSRARVVAVKNSP
jgi:hypothetical protein